MDLHRFDLNLLVTLDALLSERNVTRAGLRMNLSQSAMSGGLARLREFFQDELLVPMGRQMVLTPIGAGSGAARARRPAAGAGDNRHQTAFRAGDVDAASSQSRCRIT